MVVRVKPELETLQVSSLGTKAEDTLVLLSMPVVRFGARGGGVVDNRGRPEYGDVGGDVGGDAGGVASVGRAN